MNKLTSISKFNSSKKTEYAIIIISIIIVSIGSILSIITFILNKHPNFRVDNAKVLTPFIISVGIYDFIRKCNKTIILK